jgi:hypothetical protein
MAYNVGDPNHIDVHNQLVTDVQEAAARAGVDVSLPDTAHVGDLGHVNDHNLMALALEEIANAGGGMAWAEVTGGTVTTYTAPTGATMEVHTFLAGSTLIVGKAGFAELLLVGGGGGYWSAMEGGGGDVLRGLFALPAGSLPVVIGTGGANTPGMIPPGTDTTRMTKYGKPSSVGDFTTARGGDFAGAAGGIGANLYTGYLSTIAGGAAVEYGKAGVTSPAANTGHGSANGVGATGIVVVAVQKTPPVLGVSGVVATGGTESTYTGDGTNGVLGQKYKVHRFTAGGSLVVTSGGVVDLLLAGAGAGGSGNGSVGGCGGGGGEVWEAARTLTVGTYVVALGAAGARGVVGGNGSPGGITSMVKAPEVHQARSGAGGVANGAGGASGNGYTASGTSSGGAGAAAPNVAGAGGLGRTSYLTGAAVVLGAGGNGNSAGGDAAANTANGGVGRPTGGNVGAVGGSGVVVVRYTVL